MPTLVLSTVVARLPAGINGLAVLLYVQSERSSFSVAGVVAGALALGGAIGGPIQGRMVDRRGVTTLLPLAGVHAAGIVGILVLAHGDVAVPILTIVTFVTGLALPPSTSVLRSYWPHLLRGEEEMITAAYALDSVLIEAVFIAGPLLTAAAIATSGPAAALVVSGCCTLFGVTAFATALAKHPGPERDQSCRELGERALSSRGLRTLIVASFPLGFYLGSIEVSLPAYSKEMGHPELAGVLLSVVSISSAIAGLAFGLRRLRTPLHLVHLRITQMLPLACIPLVFAMSAVSVTGLAILAGLPVAPLVASRNQLVMEVAPRGTATEAFTWPLTAMIAGIAAGAAVGGWLADVYDWSAPLVAGALVAAAGAALLSAQQERLTPPAQVTGAK